MKKQKQMRFWIKLSRLSKAYKMKRRKKEKRIPVLLLEDLPNLGQRGEVVLVRPGFYRYLISHNKVLLATEEKLKEIKPLLLEEKIKERRKSLEDVKREIENIVLEFTLKIGPKGQVFNPITKEKIIQKLKEKGINLTKSQIDLKGKIEQKGEHFIKINLGYNILANLRIKVN